MPGWAAWWPRSRSACSPTVCLLRSTRPWSPRGAAEPCSWLGSCAWSWSSAPVFRSSRGAGWRAWDTQWRLAARRPRSSVGASSLRGPTMPSNKPTTNAPRADQPQPALSAYALLVGLLLSGAMVGLNHDFDIVGGRFEETVTAGGGLDDQAEVEQSSANLSLRRKLGFLAFLAVGGLALVGPKSGARFQLNALAILSTAALAWAGPSLLWSVDRHETFRELVRLYAYVVVAVLLARRFGVRELVAMMLIVCLISIAVDVAADIVAGTFQPWRSEFRLGGALHPNHIGRLGAIVAVAGCAALREPGLRRRSWAVVGRGTGGGGG